MKVSKDFKYKKRSLKEEVEKLAFKEKSELKIEKADIPIPVRVKIGEEYNSLPEDVTEIPREDLGQYLAVFEAKAAYISYCIARREIDLDIAHKLLKFVFSKLLTEKSSEDKITDKKAEVEADDFYMQCSMDVSEIDADVKLLSASLETMERYAKVISREITNRSRSEDNFPIQRHSNFKSDDGIFGEWDEESNIKE